MKVLLARKVPGGAISVAPVASHGDHNFDQQSKHFANGQR
jgi:hypothetical protein